MATRDELQRLHDGELSATDATRVRASLSEEDRVRLSAMEEVGSALREHLGKQADDAKLNTWTAIAGRLDEKGAEVVRLRRRRWMRPVAAAVAVAAAAALFFFWPQGSLGSGAQVESIDFGEESGLLFQLHDSNTTVIWQTTNEEIE